MLVTKEQINDMLNRIMDYFEMLVEVDKCGVEFYVNPDVAHLIKVLLGKSKKMLNDCIDKSDESEFLSIAYEMQEYFEWSIEAYTKKGVMMTEDTLHFEFLTLIKSLPNITMILENWLDDSVNGNGFTLVKISPASNCYGVAMFSDMVSGDVIDINFMQRTPFYVCAYNGSMTLGFCDFDKEKQTLIKKDNIGPGMEIMGLFPPNGLIGKYCLEG